MSIDRELLDILACPEDKTQVSPAGRELIKKVNNLIEKGELCNRGGIRVEKPVDGGLVREDGAYLYPIEDDIPIMLIEEAIPLSKIR
ncbi:MAG: Trm112 family protein [Gemmatimonadota bacterium]|nr:Trm112 family protein [Gemmatimonadota bacterium]